MKAVYVAVVLALVGLATAEVITNEKCNGRRERSSTTLVDVSEITVTPCVDSNGESDSPCTFQLGTDSNANITVTFTPRAIHKKLKASISWVNGNMELPFRGMQTNGCRSLANRARCPLNTDTEYVYSASIPLSRTFPAKKYLLKLKIMDGAKYVVCQTFYIQLLAAESS